MFELALALGIVHASMVAPTIVPPMIPPPLPAPPAPVHLPLADARRGIRSASCFSPSVANGARIVSIGTNEGGVPIDQLATQEGHRVKAVVLQAADRGVPLFLVLTAYDPVVWDLRRVPQRRLRGVYLSGYYDQAVIGAGARPVRMTSYKAGPAACGSYQYAYKGGPNLERLNNAVRNMLGRAIDRFTGGYALRTVSLDNIAAPVAPPAVPRLRDAIGVGSYRSGASADGRFGLERLVAQKAIRPATPADVAVLDAILTRRSSTGHLAPVHAHVSLSEAFVVLKPVTMPSGMYGAHSATFLIPRGVPFPKDPGSHNAYWSLTTGECRGAVCGMGD